MIGSVRKQRTMGGLGAILLLLALPTLARSQSPVVNPSPINLNAGAITTWTEGSQRVFLLKGNVGITQGLTTIRMKEAVVWADEAQLKATGIAALDIFGQGNVSLEHEGQKGEVPSALLEMSSRNEVRINAINQKTVNENASGDPLYLRAAQERRSKPKASVSKEVELLLASRDVKDATVPPVPLAVSWSGNGIQQVQALGQNPNVAPGVLPVPGVPGPNTPPSLGNTNPVVPPPPSIEPMNPPPGAPNPPRSPATGPLRQLSIRPRSSQEIQARNYPQPNGEIMVVVSSGVILQVTNPTEKNSVLDIEADRLVFWTKGKSTNALTKMQTPEGETSQTMEFYLSGNVEIRSQLGKDITTVRADEVYYDVSHNSAVALRGDLELKEPKLPYPIHFEAQEIFQLNQKLFKFNNAKVYSTVLPSDPGLRVEVREGTVEEFDVPRKNLFGQPRYDPKTGLPRHDKLQYFTGISNVTYLEGVPIGYFPYIKANLQDPLGPLENISFGQNTLFGFQLMTTWNLYDLLGMDPLEGTRWRLFADYMSRRGPALGTEFEFSGKELFDIPNRYSGVFKAYGIHDTADDILGGGRGTSAFVTPKVAVPVKHSEWRGRIFSQINIQDLPAGFTVQAQVAQISDRNYMEQFNQWEWLTALNQDTFVYVKQQDDFWAWTLTGQYRLNTFVTETNWLPKADGYLIGYKFLDLFTVDSRATVGYGQLKPTNLPPFAYRPTDVDVEAGRFGIWNQIALPFQAGPFKIVPYVTGDATYWTNTITGDDIGRLYGAAGVRTSIPFSRLYEDVHSDLWNLDGLFHKIVFSTNAYFADTSTHYNQLPQMDRLNDDASDQALRDIFPRQSALNKANAAFLTMSPLFDPQYYAIRRLLDNRTETLDRIEAVQFDVRQRLQTKRGLLGQEHVVDWMVLDLAATLFPAASRDNFGEHWGILEYDWLWNIGDRTALVSSGWYEPIDNGPRVWNVGATLNRFDNTNFYLGYRQIDPLMSRMVIASVTHPFSAKYAVAGSTAFDVGTHVQSFGMTITRRGTDVQTSLGLSFNSVLSNFGFTFEIIPNLVRGRGAFGPQGALTNTMSGR